MDGEVVRLDGVTKCYGETVGIEELDLTVNRGEVFGFLGPNGAGKTTTIRLMLDLIRPTRGRIELFGLDSRRDSVAIHRRLGYLPGDPALYEHLTGRELVGHFARLRGLPGLEPAERLAGRLALDLERPIRTLSRGNRQKVALVQALMHAPDLLVLDEPSAGLDPLMQQTVGELLREAAAEGRTVFLSSHDMAEVQRVADRVALVRAGRLVLVEPVDTLRRQAFARVEVTFAAVPPPGTFERLEGVRELDRRGQVVTLALDGEADALVKALALHRVLALESREADLEDVFLALYRDDERVAA